MVIHVGRPLGCLSYFSNDLLVLSNIVVPDTLFQSTNLLNDNVSVNVELISKPKLIGDPIES